MSQHRWHPRQSRLRCEINAGQIRHPARNTTDFDYESQMAAMNRKLHPTVETVLLLPDAALQCISSTLVREISKLGGDVSLLVSPAISQALGAAHASPDASTHKGI